MPQQLSGTIDCSGFAHVLVATDDGLQLPDHHGEQDAVWAALGGTSACQQTAAAWERLAGLHCGAGGPPDRMRMPLLFLDVLLPDGQDPAGQARREAEALATAGQVDPTYRATLERGAPTPRTQRFLSLLAHARSDVPLLLGMPAQLRWALALDWAQRTLQSGVIADQEQAARLHEARTAAWFCLRAAGLPSARVRRDVLAAAGCPG